MSRRTVFVLLGLVVSACSATPTAGPVTSVDAIVDVSAPTEIGVAVPQGKAAAVHALEAEVGAEFGLVRMFYRWDDDFPDEDLTSLMASDHAVHVSVRPRTTEGQNISWRSLADAVPGSELDRQFQDWVDRLAELPEGSFVTINHEPETRDSAPNGSAEDFIAMWRSFAQRFRQASVGAGPRLVWTMTSGAFRDERAAEWYPGDDVVDVIGVDAYNWYTCQGTDRPWRELEYLLEAPLSFAAAHGKPLALPEVASVEDPEANGRKGQWLSRATNFLLANEQAVPIVYIAWFNVTAPGGVYPDCVWDHDTSTTSAVAFARLVQSGETASS